MWAGKHCSSARKHLVLTTRELLLQLKEKIVATRVGCSFCAYLTKKQMHCWEWQKMRPNHHRTHSCRSSRMLWLQNPRRLQSYLMLPLDRKRVVKGKRVSVRLYLGGHRTT